MTTGSAFLPLHPAAGRGRGPASECRPARGFLSPRLPQRGGRRLCKAKKQQLI
jgi:hypothetical protein